MAEDTFLKLLKGFSLLALFSFLVLSVIVTMGNDYGKDTEEVLGDSLDLNKFNQSIQNIRSSTEEKRESFENQNIFSAVAGVVVTGIFDIGKSMIVMIETPFTLIGGIMTNVLYIPPIVVDVILGLIILTLIFAIWSLIKVGN